MLMNTIPQTPVGADVSRTSPIYRPSVAFHTIPLIVFIHIIGPRGGSRYPDLKVKLHKIILLSSKLNWRILINTTQRNAACNIEKIRVEAHASQNLLLLCARR